MKQFRHKTALITGGASGIGLGMARAFAARGMRLALADLDQAALEAAQRELTEAGHDVMALNLDVCDRDALAAARQEIVGRFGGVHLVCANAGVTGHMGPIEEGSFSDWDWTLDVNLKGSINTIRTFLPDLIAQGGDTHIVITSSISGLRVHRPSRGQGMYNTTKYALVGLGEALSLDLEAHGVDVTILCPGVVNTRISDAGRHRPARYGGAFEREGDHELAKAAASGTDPAAFGRWVARAVEQGQLYLVPHDDSRDQVEARHRRIEGAFDESAALIRADQREGASE